MKDKNRDRWVKYRHRVIRNIAYFLIYPYARLKYRIRIEKFRQQEAGPYLILLNHQTPFDQFFVGCSFRGPVYYLATEDIFSNGWISHLIRWLVAPIPIKKQTADIGAVKTCLRVAREGGTIAIAPEGNRTYSGKTEYMNPSIAALAKKLNLPIALYRIEGGYGAQPRWSDVVRRGRMTAGVSRVILPEEYADMTKEALFELIREGLAVNEARGDRVFTHRSRAEYLERAIYVCPRCGLSVFESHGARMQCQTCRDTVEYLPTTELAGVGFDFPFRFVNDWYEYQKAFVRKLDLSAYTDRPLFTDTAGLYQVVIKRHKRLLRRRASLGLYGDRIEIDADTPDPLCLPFAEISVVTVLGRNKLNIYHQDTVYQLKGSKRFNALKYVNIFYHNRGLQKGDNDGEFLGL